MATTRYKIAEQVQRLLAGDDPPSSVRWHIREIMESVGQVVNSLLKMEYIGPDIKLGEFIPNGASIASYDNVAVTSYKNVSRSLLPAYPIKLPRNLGVFQIYDPSNVNTLYIPIESGQAGLLASQPVINGLLGHIGYEVYGNMVVYTKDLTTILPTARLSMRLVVLDMSQYTDFDILPIPADMEGTAVKETYKLLATEPVPDKIVDPVKDRSGTPGKDQIKA